MRISDWSSDVCSSDLADMEALPERYVELMTSGENADRARQLNPIFEREVFGKKILTFENIARDRLHGLGELRTPGIADLFVAKVKIGRAACRDKVVQFV